MSYAVLLLALAFNPARAAESADDEPDDIAWSDDTETLSRGEVRTNERNAAPAPKPPIGDEDEDEPSEDEPDDEETDVHDVSRTPLPTATSTRRNPGEDDFAFEEPVTPPPTAVMPGPVTLDVAGKEPFANNYPASIVAVDRDAVVVELPVLVAKSRTGAEPFVLIASVWAGTTKVGEVRQSFEPASLAEFGPTFAFLKVAAPVKEPTGQIKVVVSKAKADGTGAAELFSQSAGYQIR